MLWDQTWHLYHVAFPAECWKVTSADGVFLTLSKVIAALIRGCKAALLFICGLTRAYPSFLRWKYENIGCLQCSDNRIKQWSLSSLKWNSRVPFIWTLDLEFGAFDWSPFKTFPVLKSTDKCKNRKQWCQIIKNKLLDKVIKDEMTECIRKRK